MGEAAGIPARLRIIRQVVDTVINRGEPYELLIGKGFGSSIELAKEISGPDLSSLDNVYITLLYENGLFGVFGYVALWLFVLSKRKRSAFISYYWYALVGLLLVGFSFVTYLYYSVNFLIVAALALMRNDKGNLPLNV
jgi:hypothetical protein